MNKIEFENQVKEKESQIQALRDDIKNIKNEYIEANREFKDGDIVRIYNKVSSQDYDLGFVEGYELSYGGNGIKPVIRKMKKDGTKSKFKLFVWQNDRVELHEGAK